MSSRISRDGEYRQVVEKILSIPKHTKEAHEPTVLREYLEAMGHPEDGIRVIHVAGTNGKGSVSRMLCEILQTAGRRVGGFFSPHLVRVNERIRVGREEMSDAALVELYRDLEEVRVGKGLPQLNFFEVWFLLAMMHFHREEVQDAVLETGLGGRFDATTSIPAALYVITEIGMDHEEYLGDTIEKIAAEKAGIITGDSPVVYHTGHCRMGEPSAADAVIEEKARKMGCRAMVNCNRARRIHHEVTSVGIDFSFRNDYDRYDHVFLKTHALYQMENAITAISAVPFLCPERSREELRELVRSALGEFQWEGRMEQVLPGVYADGAHNPSAAGQLADSVLELTGSGQWRKLQLIFGVSGDKDIEDVLKELSRVPWDRVILTCYQGSRSAAPEKLLEQAAGHFTPKDGLYATHSLREALKTAGIDSKEAPVDERDSMEASADESNGNTFTMITGSLYLVGELKNMELIR